MKIGIIIFILFSSFALNSFSQTEGEVWTEDTDNIFYTGDVSIGRETQPTGQDCAVDGKIITEEVLVKVDSWSDFVFNENYQLMPIKQLKDYIDQHGHLPSIPTQEEVAKDGISIGEMNAKLLQKIEELTLYLIEENKRLEKLEQENRVLRAKVNQILEE